MCRYLSSRTVSDHRELWRVLMDNAVVYGICSAADRSEAFQHRPRLMSAHMTN